MKVELKDLEAEASSRGHGFLLTSSDGQGPHAMHLILTFTDDGDSVRATGTVGKTAARNIGANPQVTVLWAAQDSGDYSLIADGQASAQDSNLEVVFSNAVLHRPAQ